MQKSPMLAVNLAKNRGESFWDRFIAWAMTAGRVIIILTEAIALAAFLYRFSLDQQLVSLHDHISQQKAILDLLKTNEASFRNLQARIALAKDVTDQTTTFTKVFNDITTIIPSDMQVTTFNMTQDNVSLEGTLQSISSLRSLVDTLKAYPQVSSVSIDKIQTNTSTATLSVSLTILLKTPSGTTNTNNTIQ